jgi:hypothetical protein
MQKVRLFVFAAMALMALGFAASSASATPTSTSVLLLAGDSFPVKFSSLPSDKPAGNNTVLSELQSTTGTLKGHGILLQGEILTPTGGLYEVLFLNVLLGETGKKCNSLGDPTGEVLVGKNNFFLVHDINEKEGAGILFQVKEFDIQCEGGVEIHVKGNVLGLLLPLNKEILWTGGKGSLECKVKAGAVGAGTPKENKYWTSLLSSELTARLESNFGTGFKQSCELIGAAGFELPIDVNKMIELMQ